MKLIYVLFFVSICTSLRLSAKMDLESLDISNFRDLDLKSFYNAPPAKLKIVIAKLDELIKHAQDHETVLVGNVSKYRIAYLKKKHEHERAVTKDLLAKHEAGLAKTDESDLRVAQALAKQHYDTAKTIQSGAGTAGTLAALHTVRSIIAKLLTGTHYPTTSPTTSPTYTPTTSPTKWVAPTPPTVSPTVSPTAKPFIKVGLSNTVNRSSHCKMAGEYLSITGLGVCNIADTNGNDILVDYTKRMFTKYTFLLKMTPSNTHNGGIAPHGGFEPCNSQGNANSRTGKSPEMFFIDRVSDWGYGIHHGGFGTQGALYTNKSYYGAADPNGGGDHKWSVVMKYFGGSYTLYSWTVDGVDFSKYKGKDTGCSNNGNPINYIVRIWSYYWSAFYLKNFNFCQADKIGDLC